MTAPETRSFDPMRVPLHGINNIEASAGTGKTYNIASLYLRLILLGRAVRGILVVTFTEAATEELRDRLRRRLRAALSEMECGSPADAVLEGSLKGGLDPGTARHRLESALRHFDEAAVFTIHGFCNRVLQDNTFESGVYFDTDLVTDINPVVQEVVDDFWAREISRVPLSFAEFLRKKQVDTGNFCRLYRDVAGRDPRILPEAYDGMALEEEARLLARRELLEQQLEEKLDPFYEAVDRVKALWAGSGEKILALLGGNELRQNRYSPKQVAAMGAGMQAWLESPRPDPRLFAGFERFTSRGIADSLVKGNRAPHHDFFLHCDNVVELQAGVPGLEDIFDQLNRSHLVLLERRFLDQAERALVELKRDRNIQFYDDFLVNLRTALRGDGGQTLARRLRGLYPVALIDEFQDTDPIQFEIFQAVYGAIPEEDEAATVMYLIGDPKQSIYSFRGADVFAYMRAQQQAAPCDPLGVNFRSSAPMVDAVNRVFSGAKHPFLYEALAFHPVAPSGEVPPLQLDGKDAPALHLWFYPKEPEREVSRKGVAQDRVGRSTADEIARLLNLGGRGRATLVDKPGLAPRGVEAGDIAVLVPMHRDAAEMRDALLRRGVASVVYSAKHVMDSEEARGMERILEAVAAPGDDRLLKAALLTPLLGWSGPRLHAEMRDEKRWDRVLEMFRQYHELWNEQGFIHMFRRLIEEQEVPHRLLAYADGERRLTNVLHAGELLERASLQERGGMRGLLMWMRESRRQNADETKELQLRLESDEKRVKILTLHNAKGLEFGIVFCPFLWSGSMLSVGHQDGSRGEITALKPDRPVLFHDPEDGWRTVLDFGSRDVEKHGRLALREELAERLRLTYVALTRARYACYVCWGPIYSAVHSPLAYLFHQPARAEEGDLPGLTEARFLGLDEAQMKADLKQRLADPSGGSIVLEPMPDSWDPVCLEVPPDAGMQELNPRQFDGTIPRDWRIASYSSLISGAGHDVDLPDRDPVAGIPVAGIPVAGIPVAGIPVAGIPVDPAETEEAAEPEGIFAFATGATAGTMIHAVFEDLDFTGADAAIRPVVERHMEAFGFSTDEAPVIERMVRDVIATPLLDGADAFRLMDIGPADRVDEMEFYFPLKSFDLESLPGLLREFGLPCGIQRRDVLRGYLKGFIDLTVCVGGRYYLLDYKSNHLGSDASAYHRDSLAAAMEQGQYHLQYLIYTVALDRYLETRIPGYDYARDFGGALYLFVRGMAPENGPDFGVYHDCPERELVDRLASLFGTAEVEA